jgi:osmotically inducible protein OsmC
MPTGSGTFIAGDSISGGFTYKTRFEDSPGLSPEQLIGAAHAACFSMALASMLVQAGHLPESVHTDATVTLRPVNGIPTVTKIALVTVGRVPGLDEASFTRRRRPRPARQQRHRPPPPGRDRAVLQRAFAY